MPDDTAFQPPRQNPFLGVDELSLADVSAALDLDETLTPTRRRDLRSAIRRFAKYVGRDPAMIRAHMRDIACAIRRINPVQVGIDAKTLANIKSDLARALRVVGVNTSKYTKQVEFTDCWSMLYGPLEQPRLQRGLSRLFRYCSAVGIEPDEVDDEVLSEFRQAIEEGTFVVDVDQLVRRTAQCWNEAAETIAGWPQTQLTVPPSPRQREHLPCEQLPQRFVADLDAHLDWAGGKTRFGPNRPPRVLKKSTVIKRRRMLVAAASTAIRNGVDEHSLQSLEDLVKRDVVQTILLAYYAKNGDAITAYMRCLADELISVAWHWVRLGETDIAELKAIRQELGSSPSGLTEKNKRTLRQFDDPEVLRRYLAAPDRLMAEARKKRRSAPKVAAVLAQKAAAIAILSVAPMRIDNLASLRLDQHFTWKTRKVGEWLVAIPDHETKNDRSQDYPLPAETTSVVDEYLKNFHPYLVDDASLWLFPGENGCSKNKCWLSQQISDAMWDVTGIQITAHQFRHLAGKLILDRDQGAFEVVRRLLGHKSITTTMKFYAELSTRQAGDYYAETILGLKETVQERSPHRGRGKRRR